MSKPQQGRAKDKHRMSGSAKKIASEYDKVTKNPDARFKGRKYSRITKAVLPK